MHTFQRKQSRGTGTDQRDRFQSRGARSKTTQGLYKTRRESNQGHGNYTVAFPAIPAPTPFHLHIRRMIEARRAINEVVAGPYEREADRVAEQIVPVSGAALDAVGPVSPALRVPRQEALAQPYGIPGAVPGIQPANASLSGRGRPLPESVRNFFEPRFGHDFGGVRVHTGDEAADSARAMNARAYTKGRDIVFASGEYAPETRAGRRLLAHELAHVIQQEGGAEVVQRYPGPGSLTRNMEKQVDKALIEMADPSSPALDIRVAGDIKGGAIDIAFPDFEDTSVNPPQMMSADYAMIRLNDWRIARRKTDNEEADQPFQCRAYIPGTRNEIQVEWKSMPNAVTLHHAHYDRVIYLLSNPKAPALRKVLLHEALHLYNPLSIRPGDPGADREKFVSEIRSYYYAEFRDVKDEASRFEKAVEKAEKDTQYLAGQGMTIQAVLADRLTWMKEIGAP